MGIFGFLRSTEPIVGIDIGFSGIKLVELDSKVSTPTLKTVAFAPVSPDLFSGYGISKPARIGEQLAKLLETHQVSARRAAVAIPAPCVFTKRIHLPQMPREELEASVRMEAANVIPHKIDAVRLDYHLLGPAVRNQLEVLVVAAKTEIIDGFLGAISAAGLETSIVDVDTFALQNAFELSYADQMQGKPLALVHIGARYTAVSICIDGRTMFCGDIPSGGKAITEGLAQELGLSSQEAEERKKAAPRGDGAWESACSRQIDKLATELNRQLSLFWSAAGAQEGIARIYLSGGASLSGGLVEVLQQRTGIPCGALDPFVGIDCSRVTALEELRQRGPMMTIATGLAVRQPGDKIFPVGV